MGARNPIEEYTTRLLRHESESAGLSRLSWRLSIARLFVGLAVLVVGAVATETEILPAWWAALPIAGFIVLVIVHRRVASAEGAAVRKSAFYRTGIDRLEGRWMGKGVAGGAFSIPDHPYAADLDLFGSGSLFELLCSARTGVGQRVLARWLLEPAPPDEIRRRQEAVAELRDRLDLRERLALLGEDTAGALNPEAPETWAAAPPRPIGRAARTASFVLPIATVITAVGWTALGWGPLPVMTAAVVLMIFGVRMRPWCRELSGGMRRPAHELCLFAELLGVIEAEPVDSSELVGIRDDLQTDGTPPSRRIHKLKGLGVLLDSGANMVFAPIAALLLWEVHLCVAIENWRTQCGPCLGRWFEATGRFETLNSLAGYAWEHPGHSFPEIVDSGEALYEATGLCHPLLSDDAAVANDVELGGDLRALVVSGSNMSGKSTLLRTVGTNAVLAYAGSVVWAERLCLSPMALGASISAHDSLREGRSRFYAEITRLKQITDLCDGGTPVLYLLDEIFHGTNSHDRRIGAELLVQYLVSRGAVGMVTTHDLALARLAETMAPKVRNVHFEDQLDDQGIHFDYLLKPGTVTRSNALELMKQVGLPVGGSSKV